MQDEINPIYDISVAMITYNHEKFIAKAIESVLGQDFKGKLQFIIGVDRSKDKTLEICKKYQQTYPFIQIISHQENIGMFGNFSQTLKSCNSKYIAVLEGDDYWTNSQKLSLQFLFMENKQECVLTSGLIRTVDENSKIIRKHSFLQTINGRLFFKEDITFSNKLPTLTIMVRTRAIKWDVMDRLKNSPHLDWSFYLSLIYEKNNFIYRFNKVFGAYRKHSGGVYSLVDNETKFLNILKTIFAIINLELETWQKEYLKALYSNFSERIKEKNFKCEQHFSELYNPESLLFKNGHISSKARSTLNKLAFRFLLGDKRLSKEVFIKFELLRQTKPSSVVYFNVWILPFLIVALIQKFFSKIFPVSFHKRFIKYA